MTDPKPPLENPDIGHVTPTESEAEKAAREAAAKQRFFMLSLFRLSGIAILAIAWVIILGKSGLVTGQRAKILGAIIAVIGLVQTIIVPRLLASIWRTPRP